jgi:DNA recombination protein RmuC
MSEPMLIAALCLLAGLAAGALIVWFTRPKAAADPLAELQKLAEAQRSTEALSSLNTRLDEMAKWLHGSHGQLKQTMDTRLDAVTARLGESLSASTNTTAEHLQSLHARLAVIDSAQKNIGELTTQVTSLQQILSNKQSRGAFGQAQLESLIADVLPKGAYAFQHKLSNGKMPDCAIFMPDKTALVIDAKFPLEAVTSLRNAANDEDRKSAHTRIRTDLGKHIGDIAERYFVPGETQDIALMFIPSESVYAEIHERFEDVVQRAHRSRVMIVSPTLMVMAIQVIKQVRKDAQMREAVDQIRTEVGYMMKDVGLLGDRVNKLKTHFGQTGKDIEDILTSTGRIEKRAGRIEGLEFDDANAGQVLPGPGRIEAAE